MSKQWNRRGLQILRTHTTKKIVPSLKKHELYLKLTTLEMERARRLVERDSLLRRLELINERLASVNREQAELNSVLEGNCDPVDQRAMNSSLRVCSIQY